MKVFAWLKTPKGFKPADTLLKGPTLMAEDQDGLWLMCKPEGNTQILGSCQLVINQLMPYEPSLCLFHETNFFAKYILILLSSREIKIARP